MSSDLTVDLEKGAAATEVKAAATKEVNPRMTMARMVYLDAVTVLQVLISVGAIVHLFTIPHTTWWHPLPFVAIVLLFLVLGLWIKPKKTNYAMEHTPGRDIEDLSNKLLAEK